MSKIKDNSAARRAARGLREVFMQAAQAAQIGFRKFQKIAKGELSYYHGEEESLKSLFRSVFEKDQPLLRRAQIHLKELPQNIREQYSLLRTVSAEISGVHI